MSSCEAVALVVRGWPAGLGYHPVSVAIGSPDQQPAAAAVAGDSTVAGAPAAALGPVAPAGADAALHADLVVQ